jgi:hypothetical protein
MAHEYQRIVYPERAEYLADDTVFSGYRIFLDHWQEITAFLQESYEVLRARRFSKGLIIFGKQGCGKSVLASKITGDFQRTKSIHMDKAPAYDPDNIWHRISGGGSERAQIANVTAATAATVVLQVENKKEWVQEAEKMVAGNRDRACLVIADNCEKDYFLKGLLNVSDDAYLQSGRSATALRAASHRFVELCRTTLRGCFFVFFTNDEDFALAFDNHVNEQHKGLVDIRDLKMPSDAQKEAIVRINVNRLNAFSYWLCIDRAGPDEKSAVWRTLKSAETFPATFQAVDSAIRSSSRNREGRPARKCALNAFVFLSGTNLQDAFDTSAAVGEHEDIYVGQSFRVRIYRNGWDEVFGGGREHRMLSSEWCLKIILATDSVVAALLSGSDHAKHLIEQATIYHGPGTHNTTKQAYDAGLRAIDAEIAAAFPAPDNSGFWAKGSVRNHDYEGRLKQMFPTYNTKAGGFLSARPDLVLGDYKACSVLAAATGDLDAINSAVRREANAVEFTAIKDFTFQKLVAYLGEQKIANYISVTQEQ